MCIIAAGATICGVGFWRDLVWLRMIGAAVAVPSLACFGLFAVLVPIFIVLEKLFTGPSDGT